MNTLYSLHRSLFKFRFKFYYKFKKMAKLSFKGAADKILINQKKDKPPPLTIGQLMKETLRKQRELIKDAMDLFPYFHTWSEEAFKEATTISAIKEFKPDEIIFGYDKEKSNYVYFLMEGAACVLKLLQVQTRTVYGKHRYKLYKPPDESGSNNTADDVKRNNRNVRCIFMQLCVMTKGECFGIGNELKNCAVIANTPVTCLLIPRYVLFNNDYANMWSRIEQFLTSRLPSTRELFEHFKYTRKWVNYRVDLYQKLKPDHFHTTTLHDTPYHWRVNYIDSQTSSKSRIA